VAGLQDPVHQPPLRPFDPYQQLPLGGPAAKVADQLVPAVLGSWEWTLARWRMAPEASTTQTSWAWAADAPQPVRAAPGARRNAPDHPAVPAEATIRRTLSRLDADALAGAIGAWLADRERERPRPTASRRRAVAVDGKTLRGARTQAAGGDGRPVHCWRWSTPLARCWPNARSVAPPRRSARSSRCWTGSTWPGR
jgi:hypothetical protein